MPCSGPTQIWSQIHSESNQIKLNRITFHVIRSDLPVFIDMIWSTSVSTSVSVVTHLHDGRMKRLFVKQMMLWSRGTNLGTGGGYKLVFRVSIVTEMPLKRGVWCRVTVVSLHFFSSCSSTVFHLGHVFSDFTRFFSDCQETKLNTSWMLQIWLKAAMWTRPKLYFVLLLRVFLNIKPLHTSALVSGFSCLVTNSCLIRCYYSTYFTLTL